MIHAEGDDDGYDTMARWVNHPFWFAHPLLAWLLELAMATPIFFFLTFCYLSGRDDVHALGVALLFAATRFFVKLRERSFAQRLPRPSPFFFWC